MEGEQFAEQASLQINAAAVSSDFVYHFAGEREQGGVVAPFHQFQVAMPLGQTAKVPVVPSLQMAFIDHVEVNPPFGQVV